MIDFDNFNSLPIEVIDLLNNNKISIQHERSQYAERCIAGSLWEFEEVKTEVFDQCKKEILSILEKYDIIGYHCTRLLNPNEIYNSGLKLLDPKEYVLRIKSLLIPKIKSKILKNNIIDILNKSLSSGFFNNREKMIWFLINKKLIHSSCDDFLQFWGGESLWNLMSPKREVYDILETLGTPSVIKVKVGFNDIASFQKSTLVMELIDEYCYPIDHKFYRKMRCEGFVKCDITKDKILEIVSKDNIEVLKRTIDNMR